MTDGQRTTVISADIVKHCHHPWPECVVPMRGVTIIMQKVLLLCSFLAMLAAASVGAEEKPENREIVKLSPVVVAESRAGAFFIRVAEGDITKLWFVSLDSPGRLAVKRTRTSGRTWGYLEVFRSFDLRCGDEIISINGRPVANMKWSEWQRALRSASDEPPVSVEVRAEDSQDVRRAAVVWQNSVTLGAKVPQTR